MPLANLEIVEVMRGRNLDRAGAFFRIGVIVSNDRNEPANQRQHDILANQLLEIFVLGMHRDGSVAQHCFGPRRCNRDDARGILKWIIEIIEMPVGVFVERFF